MTARDEKEALKQAAEAAATMIAKRQVERARIENEIARLQAVVDAWDAVSGKKPKKTPPAMRIDAHDDVPPSEHVKRGQVREHVDAVLGSGGDYTEPELRKEMALRFNVSYGRPTVYTALRRGGVDGRYEQKDGKRWRMKVA